MVDITREMTSKELTEAREIAANEHYAEMDRAKVASQERISQMMTQADARKEQHLSVMQELEQLRQPRPRIVPTDPNAEIYPQASTQTAEDTLEDYPAEFRYYKGINGRLARNENSDVEVGGPIVEIDEDFEQVEDNQAQQEFSILSHSLNSSSNPDQYARDMELGEKEGVHPFVISQNRDVYEKRDNMRMMTKHLTGAPKAKQAMTDPTFYEVAYDSAEQLGTIEKILTKTSRLGLSASGEGVRSIGSGVRGIGELYESNIVMPLQRALFSIPGVQSGIEAIDEAAGIPYWLTPSGYAKTVGGTIADIGEEIIPEDQTVDEQIAGAVGQIVTAFGLSMTGVGATGTASLFVGMGADQQASRMRELGIDPNQKPLQVATGAAITGLSEQLRLGSMLKVLPPSVRSKALNNVFSRIAGQAGEEALQEAAENIAHNALAMTYDENADLLEGAAESAMIGGSASAVFQTLVEIILPGKQRMSEARDAAEVMQELRAEVEAAPVFTRRREEMKKFLDNISDDQEVYINPSDFLKLYQEDTETYYKVLEEVGVSREEIDEAIMSGSDISVKGSNILTLEDSEHFNALVDVMRADPDAMSTYEVRESLRGKELEFDHEQMRALYEQGDRETDTYTRVSNAVQEAAINVGRSPEEAEAVGSIWGARFKRLEEDGVDAEKVFEKLGLRLQAVDEQGQPIQKTIKDVWKGPKPKQPQSLTKWIASQGGISEAGMGRGDVMQAIGQKKSDARGVFNEAGTPLDIMARQAAEAGFDIDPEDTQALLDAISNDVQGGMPLYRAGEDQEWNAYQDALARVEEANRENPDDTFTLTQAADQGYEGQDIGEATEWLDAIAKSLDMSKEARMQRAKDMGFDTDTVLYHGTEESFKEFFPSEFGTMGAGVYLSPDKEIADMFAGDAGKIMPLYIRGTLYEPKEGDNFEDYNFIDSLISDGYSGVYYKDAEYVSIFNPIDIRSVDAVFDTEKSQSANILYQERQSSGNYQEDDITFDSFDNKPEYKLSTSEAKAVEMAFNGMPNVEIGEELSPDSANPGKLAAVTLSKARKKLKEFDVNIPKAKLGAPRTSRDKIESLTNQGLSVKQIAARLGLSESTIYVQQKNIRDVSKPKYEEIKHSPFSIELKIDDELSVFIEGLNGNYVAVVKGADATDIRQSHDPKYIKPSVDAVVDWVSKNPSVVRFTGVIDTNTRSELSQSLALGDAFSRIETDAVRLAKDQMSDNQGNRDAPYFVVSANNVSVDYYGEVTNYADSANILRQSVDSETLSRPEFYSALNRFVSNHKQAKASAQQWKSILTKAPGIKAEELEWSGVLDLLDDVGERGRSDGKGDFVTRDELAELISSGGVELEVVTADKDPSKTGFGWTAGGIWDDPEAWKHEIEGSKTSQNPIYMYHSKNIDDLTILGNDDVGFSVRHGGIVVRDDIWSTSEAQIQAEEYARGEGLVTNLGDVTVSKWGKYVTDGPHENYREIKLTLPELKEDFYDKSHFEDKNIVSFMRVTDREIPNTSKSTLSTFFIEELQSDWHQQGRQGIYNTPREIARAEKMASDAQAEFVRLEEDLLKLDPQSAEYGEIKIKQEEASRRKIKARRALISPTPNAPFKGDAWINLTLKKAIMQAVEEGKDSLSWADAIVLNNRWSDRYAELYDNLYNKKMVKFVEKLTGITPQHYSNDHSLYESMLEGEGYWSIPLTAELKEKVLGEGFTLFQKDKQAARGFVEIPKGGVLSDPAVVVSLTKSKDLEKAANASTFIHETAHIFLELEMSLENESPAIKARMDAVRDWLGIEDGEKPTVAQHEKFAESFEAYLLEGKAPNAELRGVFRRFRTWMLDIYIDMRGRRKLRNLDPKAKEIFDGMLATQVEIEQAQRDFMGPLSTALRDVMSPEQIEKYKKYAEDAGELAKDRLFAKYLSNIKKREGRERRKQRKDLTADVTEKLMEMPVFKAQDAMAGPLGKKLNTSDVVEMRGEDNASKVKDYHAEDGVHPELAATEYGFMSGDEMLQALEESQTLSVAVKSEVDRMMAELHGDMMTDGTMESEAIEAVFNDKAVKAMEIERNVMAEKAARDPIPLSDIKAYADYLITKKPIKDILTPAKYAMQGRNLHKKAVMLAARGKWEEALTTAHKAMLQHELARRAYQAREEFDRIDRFLKRFSPRKKIDDKKVDPAYIEQINRYVALPNSENQQDEFAILNEFAMQQEELGNAVLLNGFVQSGDPIPEIRNMTMEQLRDYRDGLKNLNFLGRKNSEEAKAEKAEQFRRIQESIVENGGTKHARGPYDTDTKLERFLLNGIREFSASLRKLPFLAQVLDGGPDTFGEFYKSVVLPLREAGGKELDLKYGNEKAVKDILNKHDLNLSKRVHVRALNASLTMEQLWSLALNMGNATNIQRFAEYKQNPLSQEQIMDALNEHLTKEYWDAAQEVWDFINTRWPMISELERRTTGVAPQKVPAQKVSTPFGVYDGGYYPIKYDPTEKVKGAPQSEGATEYEAKVVKGGLMGRTQTKHGHTQKRQEKTGRKIWLSMNVLTQHLDEVAHDLAYREAFNETATIVNDPRIAQAIQDAIGSSNLNAIQTIIERVATGQIKPKSWADKWARTLRVNAASADLGLNLRTIVTQPLGLTQSASKVGSRQMARGIGIYLENIPQQSAFVMERSGFMRNRAKVITRDMRDALSGERARGTLNAIRGGAMVPMQMVDVYSVSIPTWLAAYHKHVDETGNEKEAILYADDIVANTQGSGLVMDLSTIQSGTETEKLFSYMYGYFNSTLNLTYDAMQIAKKEPVRAIWMMILLYTIPGVLAEFAMNGLAGDDDDEVADRMLETVLMGHVNQATATLPLVRESASAIRYRKGQETFYGRVLAGITQTTTQTAKALGEGDAEAAHRATISGLRTIGVLAGIPGTGTMARIYDTAMQDDDPTIVEGLLWGADDDN